MPACIPCFRLRIADRQSLFEAYAANESVLCSTAWVDVAAVPTHRCFSVVNAKHVDIPPDFIFAAELLIKRELNGQYTGGGLVGEGTLVEVLDCLQKVYEADGDINAFRGVTEELIQRYDLDEVLAVDFYEGTLPD